MIRERSSDGTIQSAARSEIRDGPTQWEPDMADNGGGGIGVLGVLVGALIVVVVGGFLLFSTGMIGGSNTGTSTVKVELPKVDVPSPKK